MFNTKKIEKLAERIESLEAIVSWLGVEKIRNSTKQYGHPMKRKGRKPGMKFPNGYKKKV